MENKNDPLFLGIPNICFSIADPDWDNYEEYRQERLKMGFDSSELFDLGRTIALFTLPRLKLYRETNFEERFGHPVDISFDEWIGILDRIIEGFELLINDGDYIKPDDIDFLNRYKEHENKVQSAMELFGKYLTTMWL